MKILLINPPNCGRSIPEEAYGIDSIKMIFRGEPLALETLAGNLDGHDITIVDLKADPGSLDQYTADQTAPDLVGITGVTCEANTMLTLADRIRRTYPRAVIVVGGHHASCDPEFFNCRAVDHVCVGLGKLSFAQLVSAIEEKRPVDIPGIAATTAKGPLAFSPRTYTKNDLVDHAAPRYDLTAQHRDKYVMSGVGGKIGFVSTAFGCTHSCFFCSIPSLTGGRYLSHSIDATLRDMALLGDIPLIRFVDANTFGNIALAEAFAQRLLDSGLNKKIVVDVRADTVVRNPDLFVKWKKAGLISVVIGFEETSEERLKAYNKKSSNEFNIQALGILKEIGIKVIGDFIISPDYSEAEFDHLGEFIGAHPIDLPVPSILTPIPGTPLHRRLKPRITTHNLDYYTFSNAVTATRLTEERFYTRYSDLMKLLHSHITH